MSRFDDIIQRVFDSLAKARRERDAKKENSADIIDGEFVELTDEPKEETPDELDDFTNDEDEIVVDDGLDSDEKIEESEEPEQVENVEEESDVPPIRETFIPETLVFPEGMSDEEKSAVSCIAAMPETTLDEVTAKAVMWTAYQKNDNTAEIQDIEGMGIWSSHIALQSLHTMFDGDNGEAWRKNEIENPLEGWSDIVIASETDGSYDASLIHSVDMKSFGLSDELNEVVRKGRDVRLGVPVDVIPDEVKEDDTPSVDKDDVPSPDKEAIKDDKNIEESVESEEPALVKGKRWNQKVYGKEGNYSIYLYGKKKNITNEQAAELKDYLLSKEKAKVDEEVKIDESTKSDDVEKPDESTHTSSIETEEVHDWADGYSDLFGGYRTMNDNGMVAYDGVLGKFEYDPSEFQLQVVHVDPDEFGNSATSYPILKYIGNEVEGKNIKIPDGLEDASFMFENNTDLQTMPKLPSSLRVSFGMFKDCSNLESAHSMSLPSGLSDAQFMFSGCGNMTAGPAVIPGNVKDATGMFANCKNLGNTPIIMSGVECCDSMFANCESLRKKPKLPQSVKYADYATYGCKGIDAAEKQAAEKRVEKSQQNFNKSLDKKSFGAHLGSMFSACMQVHAMRKSGYNMLHAMFMTHAMRKSGAFTKDMAGGWAALYKTNRSNFNQFMMMTSRNNASKRNERDNSRKAEQNKAFEATQSESKQSSKQDRLMYANGARAMKGHYFEKIDKHGYPAQKTNQQAVQFDADELASLMKSRSDMGTLSAKAKTYYAKQAVELVSNQMAYYKGAAEALNEAGISDEKVKASTVAGLSKVTDTNMGILANTIQSMQADYQFMNERQFSTVCKMMEQTSYGKTPEYQAFKNSIETDMKQRAQYSSVEHSDILASRRRVDYTQTHNTRAKEAESRFGFSDSKSARQSKPSVDTEYEA